MTSVAPEPSTVGQATTVSFTVTSSSGTPTGTVTVSDGTEGCSGTVAAGSCSMTFTTAGAKTLTAAYGGDPDFAVSTSTGVPHTVNAASTTTTITGHTPDPSVVAQPITVSYAVTSAGGTPTGNVTVDDGTVNCTGTVAAGSCSLIPLTPGTKTLTAVYAGDGNFAGSTSLGVTHTVDLAGPPSSSRSSTSASPSPITASNGTSLATITVTVRDAFNNPVQGATATLAATGTNNALTQPVGTTDATGQISGTLSSTTAELKTISATVNNAVKLAQTAAVTVDPAAADHLTFTTQPQDVALGSAITPPVVVTAWDAFDNVASGFTGDVLMALGHDGSLLGTGTLSGSKTVAAVSGVATFGDLSVDPLGIGYTLVASAPGLTGAESSGFTVLSLLP
ncbi:MAG TPA: Ig-like domain repeat protein [Gemmatimonadales bacterium]